MEILIRRDHSISWSLSLSLCRSVACCRVYRVVVAVVRKRVIVVNSSWLLLVPIGTQLFRWENRTPARSSNYMEKPIRKKRIILFLRLRLLCCSLLFVCLPLQVIEPLWMSTFVKREERAVKNLQNSKWFSLFQSMPRHRLLSLCRSIRGEDRDTRTNAWKVWGSELTDHNNNGDRASMLNIPSRSASSPVRVHPLH